MWLQQASKDFFPLILNFFSPQNKIFSKDYSDMFVFAYAACELVPMEIRREPGI